MDRDVKQRGALRTIFTKTLKKLEEELSSGKGDFHQINVWKKALEAKYAEIELLDKTIFQKMLDQEQVEEKDLEKELDLVEEYAIKWKMLQARADYIEDPIPREDVKCGSIQNIKDEVNHSSRMIKLPKLEFIKFNGDIKEWFQFWSQFKRIDEDTTIDDGDKFQYLIQATKEGSRARVLVESFPATGENYCKAIECLKKRFGREDLLIEVYIRDLLSLVLRNTLSTEKTTLSTLYDKLECHLRALETLEVSTEKCSSMLLPLVESCLPEDILRTWQRSGTALTNVTFSSRESLNIGENTSKHRLENLMSFLRAELENEQKVKLALEGFGIENVSSQNSERRRNLKPIPNSTYNRSLPTATGLLTADNGKSNDCVFCQKKHNNSDCTRLREMDLKERKSILEKKGCCYNCFKPGHRSSHCWHKIRCALCQGKHNTLICDHSIKNFIDKQVTRKGLDKFEVQDNVLTNIGSTPKVMLQTILVRLRSNGTDKIVRAIFDTASQRSYILKDTASSLKYETIRKECIQHTLFGGVNSDVIQHNVFMVYLSSLDGNFHCHFEALDQQLICTRIPPIPQGPWLEEAKEFDIQLNDFEDGPIELLIGADVAGKLYTGHIQALSSGLVTIRTKLGWTIMGRTPAEEKNEITTMLITTLIANENDISNLWSLEILGIEEPSEQKKKRALQLEAVKHFQNTVTRDNEGRYEVQLPWLKDHLPLPSNYNVALRRLNSTMRKLQADGYYETYDAVLEEWKQEGIIEEVPADELHMTAHYLPHRHIIKENSTTKLRPVFDASAREKNCPSINMCLEKGVNLIELIPAILMRFRLKRIGVIADIKKAFLQIGIFHRDRDFLRFLWYDSRGKLKTYRHKRVVFGVTCSPFLLGSVIQYHLNHILEKRSENFNDHDVNTVEKLLTSFYVDNCVSSVENESELRKFIREATDVMANGKFELRGWEYSQHRSLRDESGSDYAQILGLLWNKQRDTLELNLKNYDLSLDSSIKITKRTILSAAHRIFDPTGISCPVMLLPKLLLQQMWSLKVGWDQEVDDIIKKQFLKWRRELIHLQQMMFPRWFLGTRANAKYSLHIFCDASKLAYAAAIFLRVETTLVVSVQLVQARSRISPLNRKGKIMTIPRLELLAANIGVRLYDSIIRELSLPMDEIVFWTDSTTVLAWIDRQEQWDIFVRNRANEIRTLSAGNRWRYVPGTHNPADLPSRGCNAKRLTESKWWEGPSWLKETRECWPAPAITFDEDEINKEMKKTVTSTMMACAAENIDWCYRYFSKFTRIVRLVAWIMRFKNNSLSPRNSRLSVDLSMEEIEKAEMTLFYLIQSECFSGITDDKLANLCPYLDEDGLIRLKTKVSYGDFIKDFCYPIVLPNQKHPVVERLIRETHNNSSHVGVNTMTIILRKRFWILGGRRSIRAVLKKCVICKRHTSNRLQVQSPPLPADRVRDAKVFEAVGIDFAGPIYVKVKEKNTYEKAWICLFTCAVYRAVHLELVSSLSTDRFIQCLRKFISRRGRPSVIYTDNGTNFVGASNILAKIDWKKVNQHSVVSRIRWKFNPPTAAWWGGWWERLIGLMKQLLRRVLGKTSLDFEEMQTILCECEAVLNTRPLTYISEDPEDVTPLTPDMFLKEIEEVGVPDLDAAETVNLNRRVKYRRELRRTLKQRFQEEYLGQLALYNKKIAPRKIEVGELVLLEKENAKRLEWPLAKVEELLPGREGEVRLVRLKTAAGTLWRPIQRVFPLEISGQQYVEEKKRMTEASPIDGSSKSPRAAEVTDKEIYTRSGRRIRAPPRLNL